MGRRRSGQHWTRRLWLAGVLTVTASAGIGWLAVWSPLFAVEQVKVSGTQQLDAAGIAATVKERTQQNYFGLTSHSLWLVNPAKIATETEQKFDDIAKIELTKRWPRTLQVQITERQQALLWQSGEQRYLVDKQGIAFAASGPRDDLVSVVDGSGLAVEIGKQVVGAGFIKELDQIQAGMTAAQLPVKQYRIPETTFEVQAVTTQGWYALFDATRSIENQVASLQQALTAGKPPREYADLRVPGRVYLK